MRRALLLLAACGGGAAEPSASRCRDATTLETQVGDSVITNSCPAWCGPDPAGGGGAACVTVGQACGAIGAAGACAGAVRAVCDGSGLALTDCGDSFAVCGAAGGRAVCTTACALAGVTPEGRCEAGTLVRCDFADGGYSVVRAACPVGSLCADDPDTGGAACLPAPTCSDLGPIGRCDGATLSRCVGGAVIRSDCGAGAVCAWGGAGYACVAAGAAGALQVTGAVRYEDRPLGPDGLGALTPAPARGVAVAVIDDATGAARAAAATSDAGAYTLRYDAPAGALVHVLAVSTSLAPGRPVRVLRPDGTLHGFGSARFAAGASAAVDLLVTEASGAGEAFNLVDVAVTAQDVIRADLGVAEPARMDIVWAKGATDGTNTDRATRIIHLIGGLDDDDGYDDAVLAHELGHFVELTYGGTSNPFQDHSIYQPELPTLAWSEGWASYFGARVRGDPVYFDSNALGGVRFDIATDVTRFVGSDERDLISENTVSEILWQLDDSGAGVDRVEPRYLRTAPDRGFAGVDLVDFADGWLAVDGAGTCPALSAALASRAFPYDFAGPVGCP